MSPVSDPATSGDPCPVLRPPSLLTREVLAGVLSVLVLIPKVIPSSVIADVDPQVNLVASVVFCLAMLILGGRPAMVTTAAGLVALVIGPMVYQYGVGYILPAVILVDMIQILFGLYGMAYLMRFIPPAVMTGFVNTLGILTFFTQVPRFQNRQPLITDLFVLALFIVLWAPCFIGAAPAPPIAVVALALYTATTDQQLPTVSNEDSMDGGLPGFTALTILLNLTTLRIVRSCALSIALIGLIESLLATKLMGDLTHAPLNKSWESAGLGIANVPAGCYGDIAGCAMIGQAIVNVKMGRTYSRLSAMIAGLVLFLLVTALNQVMAQIPVAVLVGVMATVAVKTSSWHGICPGKLTRNL